MRTKLVQKTKTMRRMKNLRAKRKRRKRMTSVMAREAGESEKRTRTIFTASVGVPS